MDRGVYVSHEHPFQPCLVPPRPFYVILEEESVKFKIPQLCSALSLCAQHCTRDEAATVVKTESVSPRSLSLSKRNRLSPLSCNTGIESRGQWGSEAQGVCQPDWGGERVCVHVGEGHGQLPREGDI